MTDAGAIRAARLQRGAAVLGVAGLAGCGAAAVWEPRAFYPGYLMAFVFWLNLSLGSWALLMVHGLVGGGWGLVTRRVLEAAARVLPVMALLFIPILFGLRTLYPWARPEELASDAHLRHLRPYLNVGFFVARTLLYFACWIACVFVLDRGSAREEHDPDPALRERRRRLSAGGLVLYVLTIFFASLDWVLSIEPHWSSSISGLLAVSGQGLGAFAFSIATLVFLSGDRRVGEAVTKSRLNDLGNLLLTAVLLWAYLSFSQYLIIWSENLPRETRWYVHRAGPGWRPVALALIVLHVAVPFLLLLFRRVRTRGASLAAIALGLLVLRLVDDYWRIIPAFEPERVTVRWAYLVAPLGVGGIWLAAFVAGLRRRPLLPPMPAEAPHAS